MVYVSELRHKFGFGTSVEKFPSTAMSAQDRSPARYRGTSLYTKGVVKTEIRNDNEARANNGSRPRPYPTGAALSELLSEAPALVQRYLARCETLDRPRPPRPGSSFMRAYVPSVNVKVPVDVVVRPSSSLSIHSKKDMLSPSTCFRERRESRTSWMHRDLIPTDGFQTVGSTLVPPRQSPILQYAPYDAHLKLGLPGRWRAQSPQSVRDRPLSTTMSNSTS